MRAAVHVFQIYRVIPDDLFWWRLVSPNGRAVARAAVPLASAADALASIPENHSLDALTARVRPTDEGRWRWTLELDGTTVVVGVGDHDRRVRCEHASRRFTLAAPLAVVSGTTHSFQRGRPLPSGSSWSLPPMRTRPVLTSLGTPFSPATVVATQTAAARVEPGALLDRTIQGAG